VRGIVVKASALVMVGVGVVTLAACQSAGEKPAETSAATIEAPLGRVERVDWPSTREAGGVVRARQVAVQRFGVYSLEGFLHVEPLPGALTLMRSVGRDRLVVVSGADQNELRQVFREKQIEPLVSEVLGAPIKKLQLVETVLAARGVPVDEALLIGDGARDFEACRTLGMHFVYLHEHSEWDGARAALAEASDVRWAETWTDLLAAAGLVENHDTG